jgi:hypothetical protein
MPGWEPRAERLAGPPPPQEPGESDEQYYWRILPKPPQGDERDSVIAEWIDDVAYVGGVRALNWLRQSENWPLSSPARARMMYHVSRSYEQLNDEARRANEAAARDQASKQETERQRARREAGW